MVSVPSKFSRCAQPPMMLCSTHVQPRKPKSCSLLPRSGEAVPCGTFTERFNKWPAAA